MSRTARAPGGRRAVADGRAPGRRTAPTFGPPRCAGRGRALLGGVAAGVALAVAVVVYLIGAERREIQRLFDLGRYEASLAAASRFLRNDDDSEVRALADAALVRSAVPDWLRALSERRFDRAGALLESAADNGRTYPEGQRMLAALAYVGDLERFFDERGGPGAPLQLFRDEARIEALLQRREALGSAFGSSVARVAELEPRFQSWRVRAEAHERVLRDERDTSLPAIAALKQALADLLSAGRAAQALETLLEFSRRHPQVQGVGALGADIDRLAQLQRAGLSRDRARVRQLSEAGYATPLVATIAQEWASANLPWSTTAEP